MIDNKTLLDIYDNKNKEVTFYKWKNTKEVKNFIIKKVDKKEFSFKNMKDGSVKYETEYWYGYAKNGDWFYFNIGNGMLGVCIVDYKKCNWVRVII